MRKRLFMFVTPDGFTYSSPHVLSPDVDNFQVLGFGEGKDEEEAFKDFLQSNGWVLDTPLQRGHQHRSKAQNPRRAGVLSHRLSHLTFAILLRFLFMENLPRIKQQLEITNLIKLNGTLVPCIGAKLQRRAGEVTGSWGR
ncbi:hypothetical protein [Thermococcus sp.]|uniref:hypothetical protein n=1 Tax=Thermococcus sp. TaxID=35749 RepID=UPI0026016CF4|nr:hypothetical protein [Thermococcus sp.]